MNEEPAFDVRVSAKRRAILRLAILSVFSTTLIVFGLQLMPEYPDWSFTPETLEMWDGWAFVGLIMVGSGVFGLLKEAVFGLKSLGQAGHWHFRLTESELLWDVPVHAHGEEIGFRAALSEVSSLELRTIEQHEALDVREYWVHFRSRNSIKLQSYSGVSLSWLVSKIEDAGIEYRKTTLER